MTFATENDAYDYGSDSELLDYLERENNNTLAGNNGGNTLASNLLAFGNVGASIIGAVKGKPKPKKQTSLGPILLIGGAVVAVLLIVVLLVRR